MNAVSQGAGSGGLSERKRWISRETVEENKLRAAEAIERAGIVCEAARIEREKARAAREKARGLRTPEAMLPPLEFVLPPLEAALAYLDYGLPPLPESWAELEMQPAPRRAVLTVLYAWGYSRAAPSIVQQQFRETEEARRFAAERGWDRRRPGAWAGEQVFAMSLHAALRKIELIIRVDLSVVGWGGKLVRAD